MSRSSVAVMDESRSDLQKTASNSSDNLLALAKLTIRDADDAECHHIPLSSATLLPSSTQLNGPPACAPWSTNQSLAPSASSVFNWRHPSSVMTGVKRPHTGYRPFCGFCKTNGEPIDFYSSHSLKDTDGRVVCPILRSHKCEFCGATGDDAHTRSYCPFARIGREILPADSAGSADSFHNTVVLKHSRINSAGQQRHQRFVRPRRSN